MTVGVAQDSDHRQGVVPSLLVLGLVSVVALIPVIVVVVGGLDVSAWHAVLIDSTETHRALINSVLLALRAPFAAFIGLVIAWLLVRWPIPGRGVLEVSFWIAFMMPLLPLTLGWSLLLDEYDGLVNQLLMMLPFVDGPVFDINSLRGITWVHMTASTVPVMIIMLAPAIRQMDRAQEEAARMSGASPAQVFRQVTLPLLIAALATGTMLGFIRGLEAFEVEQVLGAPVGLHVYTTRVFDLVNWEPPRFTEAMALSTAVLIALVGLAAAHRRGVRGHEHATISGRGMSTGELTLGRARYLISAFLFAMVAVTVLLPAVFLVLGSFMTLFGFFAIDDPFTLEHWRTVLGDTNFLVALRNSLVIGLGAGFFGTLVCATLAYVIVRSTLRYRAALDFVAWLPWCVPGILLGVGLLSLVLSSPLLGFFYGSLGLLVFAVVIGQLPLGVNLLKSSVSQVSGELEAAASVCGAGKVRVFLEIVLPLIRPMLVSVFVLIVIAGLRDISTTVLLAQPTTLPLSVLLFEYAISGAKESAAVVGLIVTLIILAVALVARRAGLMIDKPAT